MSLKEILDWAKGRDIVLHPSIEVKQSDLGGYGLFSTGPIKAGEVLVRVKKSSALNINSLLEYKCYLDERPDKNRFRTILNATLETGGARYESIIIRSFLWGFAMILQSDCLKSPNDLDDIKPYLNILLDTPVLEVDEQMKTPDSLIQELIREKRTVKRDYLKLAEVFPETRSLMTFDTAFHLHQAVKSRVLDVPEYDPQCESEADEYVTNITMVPILDFTNHSNHSNAVFDIDLESDEDIILRLNRSVHKGIEITMRYDTDINVNSFVRTYGFVPEPSREFTWEIPDWVSMIREDGEDADRNEYEKIAHSFGLFPEICIWEDINGTVSSDLLNFAFPLLLICGLIYYKDSPEECDAPNLEITHTMTQCTTSERVNSVYCSSNNDNTVEFDDIRSKLGTDNPIEMLVKRTADTLLRLGSIPRSHTVKQSRTSQNMPLEDYEIKRDEMLDKFFAIPYETLLDDARQCICAYIFPGKRIVGDN